MPTPSNRWNRTSSTRNAARRQTADSWSSTTRTNRSKSSRGTTCAPGYQSVWSCLNQKAAAYKTLVNQTCGAAKCKRPSPTTLNTLANWVNKGAHLHCATRAQICKWAGRPNKPFKPTSATAVKNALCNKFGKSTIKAVCCDKTGKWLIATAPTWKGKPFCFPC